MVASSRRWRGLVWRVTLLRIVNRARGGRRIRCAWTLLCVSWRTRIIIGAGRRVIERIVIVIPIGRRGISDSWIPGSAPSRSPRPILTVGRCLTPVVRCATSCVVHWCLTAIHGGAASVSRSVCPVHWSSSSAVIWCSGICRNGASCWASDDGNTGPKKEKKFRESFDGKINTNYLSTMIV